MRRKDLRGEKECSGAEALIRSRIWTRDGAEKIVGSWRLVMRRVFDGGEGIISGGSEERSSVRGVDEGGEEGLFRSVAGGEMVVFAMVRSTKGSLQDQKGGNLNECYVSDVQRTRMQNNE